MVPDGYRKLSILSLPCLPNLTLFKSKKTLKEIAYDEIPIPSTEARNLVFFLNLTKNILWISSDSAIARQFKDI